MSKQCFVDTSVLVRHLVQDGGDLAVRASALIEDVARGSVELLISETVVLETVYVLSTIYGIARQPLCEQLINLLSLPGIIHSNKSTMLEAFRFWASQGPLSFADCYHLALTADLGLTEICSFDKKMGRYPGVTRIEP